LASGSDDKTVNIYSYQPDHSLSQFSLATSIDTSHSANIFSVKFMPNSNDSKLVTCAGDNEVRVFDIQRSSQSSGTRTDLTTHSTNAKVFRSHSSAVKRIVTEASPYYFLTCSEDGEVRQWDIRQPESAYPGKSPFIRRVGASLAHSEVPPPLISYAPYNIELWTISCSPSQPHYIALGGTHLHCFLHDRRMLGRNKLSERGGNIPRSLDNESSAEALYDATRCVAKFAPYGQPRMSKNDSGKNISACKLGTADPNELIVSWMGEDIYKFNILKDIKDSPPTRYGVEGSSKDEKSRNWAMRKRKRVSAEDGSPSDGPNLRTRANTHETTSGFEVIVRVGGVPVSLASRQRTRVVARMDPESGEAHAQKIRTLKNALAKTHFAHDALERSDEMLEILLSSSKAFEKIDNHIATRTYPVTDSQAAVEWELKLRNDRAKVWRYTQASGTLARVLLGYRTQPVTDERARGTDLEFCDIIKPAPREGSQPLERHEHFGYDFIKAVLLWLESGVGAVLREFSNESRYVSRATKRRLPVPRDAGINALDSHLLPYLESLAADIPIIYAGHGGAGDDPRQTDEVFSSEKSAVRALGQAMKIQFEDLHKTGPSTASAQPMTLGNFDSLEDLGVLQNRNAAITFWGHRVCMAVLNSASIDVNYPFVSAAFEDHREQRHHSRRPRDTVTNDDEAADHDEGDSDEYESSLSGSDDSSSEDSSEDDGVRSSGHKKKFNAAKNVPASTHLRKYAGHCNVDTTKDVNFYGRNDEYVVSGSDCGNLFIWDKKTSRLMNILMGDDDVVNVIQREHNTLQKVFSAKPM
jgi:nuclear receptor interaction protein